MHKEDKQEMIGLAESLFKDVKSYRTKDRFELIFNLCLRFWRLSPFNVLLVEAQCPNAKYVFTARQWERDYGRRIKYTARPIVYLNFSPVGFLYELGDTEEIPGTNRRRYHDLMKEISNPFKCDITIQNKWVARLYDGLNRCGIELVDTFDAASSHAGHIALLREPIIHRVLLNDNQSILYDRVYHRMALNRKIEYTTVFLTIIHELAHYFLRHIPAPPNWKNYYHRSGLSTNTKEFEAETTVYLVCGRLGCMEYTSAKYLNGYLDKNGMIPEFSFDDVSKSVILIEKMIHGTFSVKDTYLYKYDSMFAEQVKKYNKHQ